MAKRYVKCNSVEEVNTAGRAGILYWMRCKPDGTQEPVKYLYSALELGEKLYACILVDDDDT